MPSTNSTGVAPVAFCIQVAERQHIQLADLDTRYRICDFPRNKLKPAQGRFVVEENPRGGEDAVGFTVIYGRPVRMKLSYPVWTSRIEGCVLDLRRLLNFSEHLGG